MNWLLIIVLAILLVNAMIGMKVGFIKTVFSLFSLIIALVLTVWISPVVNNYLKSNDTVYEGINSRVEKMLPFEEEETEPEDQTSLIEELKIPQSLKDSLVENNNSEVYKALAANSFKDYVSNYLTGVMINALAFFGTFIVLLIILWVLCFALDIVSKLPILDQINKSIGLLAGVVHGLVVIWLFFILLTVFGSTEFGQNIMKLVDESQILSIIYNNNFLLRFITSATKMIF